MSTKIDIPAESSAAAKGKAPLIGMVSSSSSTNEKGGFKKGIAILDFLLRIGAIVTALSAAGTMGASGETLPFFTQFFQFEAGYDDLPALQFFVVAMAVVGGYLVLSLPFSIVTIIRPHAVGPRLLLLIFDTVALTLNTSAAAAATAIVYLAHNGNEDANWLAICVQFGDFCQQISGAVIAAFVSAVVLVVLVIISGVALRRQN
ncbi:hypothetical protein JCGZ_08833 [Jatropha curcas]|uniref:CASP-like protein n=1 Tax=Jatropha curcas TaxID=180498 RepID=A0A067KWI4_JATCU|nr:casparian strip membrane protein 1 [Jatropha curcas]KDP36189.1 hypothetical protein JCGZ_08833 [Jatropha curcas]